MFAENARRGVGLRSGSDDIEPAPAEPLAYTQAAADHAGKRIGDHSGDHFPGIDPVDTARISAMCETLRSTTTEDLLMDVFSGVDGAAGLAETVQSYCTFDHGALLVFPHSFEDALTALRTLGATPGDVMPSVIVKGRLSKRYRIAPELLDVRLTHATLAGRSRHDHVSPPEAARSLPSPETGGDMAVPPPARVPGALSGADGRTVEVFMLPRSPSIPGALVDRERSLDLERHFALRVPRPDPVVIQGLRWLLWEQAGFTWDGGGYNPHDDRAAGGTSVLYFLRSVRDTAGLVHRRRLEVKFPGDFSHLTRTHMAPGRRSGRHPGRRPVPPPTTAQIPAPVPARATDSA